MPSLKRLNKYDMYDFLIIFTALTGKRSFKGIVLGEYLPPQNRSFLLTTYLDIIRGCNMKESDKRGRHQPDPHGVKDRR